jgi:cardiolipin synthase
MHRDSPQRSATVQPARGIGGCPHRFRASLTKHFQQDKPGPSTDLRESPYTLPNALTLLRIVACPFLGYTIVHGQFAWATGLLFASGFTDWVSTLC